MPTPEIEARVEIDSKLVAAGWIVQDRTHVNLGAGAGIAVREFSLKPGHGTADYLQYVDAEAIGVIETKPSCATLTSAEAQARRYSEGLPDDLNAHLLQARREGERPVFRQKTRLRQGPDQETVGL